MASLLRTSPLLLAFLLVQPAHAAVRASRTAPLRLAAGVAHRSGWQLRAPAQPARSGQMSNLLERNRRIDARAFEHVPTNEDTNAGQGLLPLLVHLFSH